MEKTIETTISEWGMNRNYIERLYRDNGNENGNYYMVLGPYLGNQSAFKKGRSRICKLLEVNTMIFGHCIKNGRSARFGVESRISRVYHPFEAILIILYRVYSNPQLPNPKITF